MRWEDERYVKVFTRDTPNWALLPWQARCLFLLVLRKVDRIGRLELPSGEEVAALAALLLLPPELVSAGLEGLLQRQTVVLTPGALAIPNFFEAQESRTSDRVRKQASRERAAEKLRRESMAAGTRRPHPRPDAEIALGDAPPDEATDGHTPPNHVAGVHTSSHDATSGHTPPHDVTPSRAEPSRAEPNHAVPPPGGNRCDSPRPSERREALQRLLIEEYQSLRPGEKYLHGGAKDTKALKSLMAITDNESVVARWRFGLSRPAKEWASCSTFAELARKWTVLAAPQTNNAKGPVDPATQNHEEGAIEL